MWASCELVLKSAVGLISQLTCKAELPLLTLHVDVISTAHCKQQLHMYFLMLMFCSVLSIMIERTI